VIQVAKKLHHGSSHPEIETRIWNCSGRENQDCFFISLPCHKKNTATRVSRLFMTVNQSDRFLKQSGMRITHIQVKVKSKFLNLSGGLFSTRDQKWTGKSRKFVLTSHNANDKLRS
jgi:hypothetical protein